MDTRAKPTARTVSVVIAVLVVGRSGVLWSEEGPLGVAFRIEGVWVGEYGLVVMETPDIDEDGRALG